MDMKDMDVRLEYQILNNIFMKTGDGFFIMDNDKRIKFMNQHLIYIYGNQIGKKCHEMFFDNLEPCNGCSINEILEDNKESIRHTRCDRDKLGRWLEMTCLTTTIGSKGLKGENTYIIGMASDMTSRKKLEDALRVKNQELIQKNEELEKFVYTVSHDLKSPILSLQGVVSVLMEDYADKLDNEFREYLEDIKKSAQKMGLLIQDLLDLSRVGRTRNPREEIPARDIINEVVDRLKFQLNSKGVELHMDEEMPVCYCDKQMIILALVNLLDNAIKFVGNNPHPRIDIGCRTQGDYHVFYVKDNGIGIDPKYYEKIFEIFQTLNEIKDPRSTGVGLAIVKRAVDVHMGKVWVESEKGKGSTFFISLPSKEVVLKKTGK